MFRRPTNRRLLLRPAPIEGEEELRKDDNDVEMVETVTAIVDTPIESVLDARTAPEIDVDAMSLDSPPNAGRGFDIDHKMASPPRLDCNPFAGA